jgi:hypothetical protein
MDSRGILRPDIFKMIFGMVVPLGSLTNLSPHRRVNIEH